MGDEDGEGADGVGGDVEFFEGGAELEGGREGDEVVAGDVESYEGGVDALQGWSQEGWEGVGRARGGEEEVGRAW